MSDEIVKALPEWFVDRLRRWATFRLHSGAYAVPSSWPSDGNMGDRPDTYGSPDWNLLGSVHETNVAIDELPARYRQAVQQFWIMEGQGFSLRDHARRRQVSHPTFATWLRKGHELLRAAFREQSERKKHLAATARAGLVLNA